MVKILHDREDRFRIIFVFLESQCLPCGIDPFLVFKKHSGFIQSFADPGIAMSRSAAMCDMKSV